MPQSGVGASVKVNNSSNFSKKKRAINRQFVNVDQQNNVNLR